MGSQPTKIGKYDIVRVIGRGGMGMVYQAVDPTIGRMVAIKKVTAVLSDDPDLLKRFYREAQSTGKLQHPNIVTLHDLGDQDGVPYLVMEYLEGDSLEKIIRERRQIVLAEKLNIIIQSCEGLAYAHHRQIIHRDVKPGNIVVLNDGGVKIVDFGIAQFGNERYTRTGQVIGSLYYMSPEQIQDGDIDSRSDIYSTGVVLFEFLTGSLPFQGRDPTSTLARILHEPPPPLSNFLSAYPAELDEIIRHALAKDRNVRYTSMEDFAFDLRTVQEKLSQELIANFLRSAETCIQGRDWDKAREHLRQVLNLDKQHRRANELLREVQVQIQRQQLSEQVRQLRSRADDALAMRNWDEALNLLDHAVKIDGTNSELIQFRDSVRRSSTLITEALRRAESAHDAGDLEAAKRAVEEALNVDPSNTTAKALNAILSKEISERSKRKKVDDFIVGARKEIALRHFTSALELLRGAETLDPSVAEVQQLIRSAAAGREHERRRQALEKACSEIEELLNRDEYAAACDKAEDALQSFPQDLGLLKLKGFAEKQREAWSRHQFIDAQMASARQLSETGQLAKAQRVLNDALDRYPDDSGIISLLGMVTDGIARQEAQRREAERQANERRHYIRLQLETVAELQRSGQTAQALKKLRDASAHYPDSDELRNQIAVLEAAAAREEAARERAEQEARQKKAEVEKLIAESWQLLSNKQTGQAVVMLDQAVRRHPTSEDLKSQLEFAQRRLAVEQAERERAEQEARRRRAEILKEIAAAQQLLDSGQSARGVAALEQATGRYSESEELRSLLQFAQRRLAADQAEKELAEKEARRKRAEIQQEIMAARQLLDAKRNDEAVAHLEQVLRRYPGSDEVGSALEYARQQLAVEESERRRAEEAEHRRRSWIDAEITVTRQWMDAKQPERAVTSLQQALNQYPESEELKSQLDSALRRLELERVEREHAAQEARRRREEIDRQISTGQELLDAGKNDQAVVTLEKSVLQFPESKELRSQFELAKQRFEEEEREKQSVAEEQRRKHNEIEGALRSAQQLLESKQTARAVPALEQGYLKYPDSTELKTLLDSARQRLAAEEAEREKARQEALGKQKEIEKEVAKAAKLLESGQTRDGVTSLQESLRRFPNITDIQLQLERAQKRLAEEEAERQRKEQEKRRKLAEIASALVDANQLLDSNQTSRALTTLEQALRSHPQNQELQDQLAVVRKRYAVEQAERERAEREARRRKDEADQEIAAARQLLESRQTPQAITALEAASAKFPESQDIQSLLQTARQRLVRELEEKRHAEEQAKRRQAEIESQLTAGRRWLESNQIAKAVEALEPAVRKYPENKELRSLFDEAQGKLKQERAAQEKADREAQARRQKIGVEVENARRLLKAKDTEKALAALEESTVRYPESDELRSLLAESKEQQARARADREQAEKRQAQLRTESAKAKSLLEAGKPEEALKAVEAALRTFAKEPQLLELQESAKSGIKLKKAEEKKRAAENEKVEAQKRQRARDLDDLRQLSESVSAAAKPAALDKLLRKANEIAARYPSDTEFQQSLAKLKSAIESLQAEKQRSAAAEPSHATRGFSAKPTAQSEAISRPSKAAPLTTPQPASAGVLPQFLNKWVVIGVLGLLVAGFAARHFLQTDSGKTGGGNTPTTFVVTVETLPPQAKVQVGSQTCVTPACNLTLPPGTYQITADLPGYKPLSQTLVVDAQIGASPVRMAFEPLHPETAGYLIVNAGVEGADVLLNGTKYSQTGAGGTIRLTLPPNQYNVEVRKKGFAPSKSLRVPVQTGLERKIDFSLTPATPAKLVIAGATPNAEVLADGHYLGLTGSDGKFSQTMDPGEYEIALKKDGRTSTGVRKTFIAGQPAAVDGNQLKFAAVPVAMATVILKDLPPTAIVKVDGSGNTYRPDASGTLHLQVPPGDRTIDITAEGFEPKPIHQSFASGEHTVDVLMTHVDKEGPAWAKVESTADMSALQGFLNEYPTGKNAKQAESKLEKLIAANDSEKELKDFYEKFPKTSAGESARKKVDSFVRAKDQEILAIRGMFDQYRLAYEQRDFKALSGLYPGASENYRKATQSMFKNAVSVTIELSPDSPKVDGDLATVKVKQKLTWVLKDKSQSEDSTPQLTWQLAKKDGRWLIQKGP